MNDMTTIAKPRKSRAKGGSAKPDQSAAETAAMGADSAQEVLSPEIMDAPTDTTIVPSSPEPIPLIRLRRAPENVRHTRIDEDVDSLADDIRAHGLLSSLIGYESVWPEDNGRVFIVGGGRRLQALQQLAEGGYIGWDFAIPVLVRPQEDAVELSLSENLQQRTMSPVDEFFAFKALMDRGTNSPAGLAKRFGFTERTVKQRLRLAALTPEVLEALAGRAITLDAAMAFATTEDQKLQGDVFKAHRKSPYDPFNPERIRRDLKSKGIDTSHPLFKFVTAEIYEREGGEYEDDLFADFGADRVLKHPHLLEAYAHKMIDFQMIGRLRDLQDDEAFSPSIAGYVKVPDLRLHRWGTQAKFKLPSGYVQVEKHDSPKVWNTIRNNGIAAHVCVGINDDGDLIAWPRIVFVPSDQKKAVDPTPAYEVYRQPTPEEREAEERERGIARWSRRLAVGSFAGTPLEGRAYWPDPHEDRQQPMTVDGVQGYSTMIKIFVSNVAIAEQVENASARYEQAKADRAAAIAKQEAARLAEEQESTARQAELVDMEPPAIALIDGDIWERAEDGSYSVTDDGADGYVPDWLALLANFEADLVEQVFATRDEFEAAMAAEGERDAALVAQALAMDPEPAVVVLDGEPWARGESGTYTLIGADADGVDTVETLAAVIALYSECLDAVFATRDDYDAAIAADAGGEVNQ